MSHLLKKTQFTIDNNKSNSSRSNLNTKRQYSIHSIPNALLSDDEDDSTVVLTENDSTDDDMYALDQTDELDDISHILHKQNQPPFIFDMKQDRKKINVRNKSHQNTCSKRTNRLDDNDDVRTDSEDDNVFENSISDDELKDVQDTLQRKRLKSNRTREHQKNVHFNSVLSEKDDHEMSDSKMLNQEPENQATISVLLQKYRDIKNQLKKFRNSNSSDNQSLSSDKKEKNNVDDLNSIDMKSMGNHLYTLGLRMLAPVFIQVILTYIYIYKYLNLQNDHYRHFYILSYVTCSVLSLTHVGTTIAILAMKMTHIALQMTYYQISIRHKTAVTYDLSTLYWKSNLTDWSNILVEILIYAIMLYYLYKWYKSNQPWRESLKNGSWLGKPLYRQNLFGTMVTVFRIVILIWVVYNIYSHRVMYPSVLRMNDKHAHDMPAPPMANQHMMYPPRHDLLHGSHSHMAIPGHWSRAPGQQPMHPNNIHHPPQTTRVSPTSDSESLARPSPVAQPGVMRGFFNRMQHGMMPPATPLINTPSPSSSQIQVDNMQSMQSYNAHTIPSSENVRSLNQQQHQQININPYRDEQEFNHVKNNVITQVGQRYAQDHMTPNRVVHHPPPPYGPRDVPTGPQIHMHSLRQAANPPVELQNPQ